MPYVDLLVYIEQPQHLTPNFRTYRFAGEFLKDDLGYDLK